MEVGVRIDLLVWKQLRKATQPPGHLVLTKGRRRRRKRRKRNFYRF